MKCKIILITILSIIYCVAFVMWLLVPELLTLHPLIMAICGIGVLVIVAHDARQESHG